jgi:hypothetical protein
MSEWQPIETAPKDGSVFLAFDQDNGDGISNGVVICYWSDADEDDEFDAEWMIVDLHGTSELHGCNLTKWTPIPLPPRDFVSKRDKPLIRDGSDD